MKLVLYLILFELHLSSAFLWHHLQEFDTGLHENNAEIVVKRPIISPSWISEDSSARSNSSNRIVFEENQIECWGDFCEFHQFYDYLVPSTIDCTRHIAQNVSDIWQCSVSENWVQILSVECSESRSSECRVLFHSDSAFEYMIWLCITLFLTLMVTVSLMIVLNFRIIWMYIHARQLFDYEQKSL